jgi:hypothetical protein
MAGFYKRGFQIPGTPEYVVARAGLLRLDADDVKACDMLTRLYGQTPMRPRANCQRTVARLDAHLQSPAFRDGLLANCIQISWSRSSTRNK